MDRPDVPTSLQDSLQFDRLFDKIAGARILATASASHNTAAGNAVQVCGPVASCIQYFMLHPKKMDVHLNVNLDSRGLLSSNQLSFNSSTMPASFGQPKRGEVLKAGQLERRAPACYLKALHTHPAASHPLLIYSKQPEAEAKSGHILATHHPKFEGNWISTKIIKRYELRYHQDLVYTKTPFQPCRETKQYVDLACGGLDQSLRPCQHRFYAVHDFEWDMLLGTTTRRDLQRINGTF